MMRPEAVSGATGGSLSGRSGVGATRRQRLLFAFKVAVSAVLLTWILSRASLREVFGAIGSADLLLLLTAYALEGLGVLISTSRWRLLLRTQGETAPSLGFLIRSYLVATFFNNVLPSTVGGDASRAYDCYQEAGAPAMSSVLVDRLLGLLALMLFALIGLPFAAGLAERAPMLVLALWLGAAALLAALGAIFWGRSWPRLRRLLARLPERLAGAIALVWNAFRSYRGQWGTLLRAFGLSLLLQANVVLYYVLIARALHLDAPALSFFLIVPLATFVTMLPISINGIGLREGALATMLGWYGVATAGAVALAWLVYLSSVLFGLIGGIVYAVRR
jgi:glycosyltransferase 2 family protein